MGKHFSKEFKEQVLNDYKRGLHGGLINTARYYSISDDTLYCWVAKDRKQGNLDNDINHIRGRKKKLLITKKDMKY